jgi:hypothetical protein
MRRIVAMTLITLTALAGCSIQPEASPNDLPSERADVFGDPSTGDEAAGTNRIYLLAPPDVEAPQRLRSAQRDVPPAADSVLESLFAGPNADERDAELDTAIPADIELLDARPVGELLTIDLNDVFD